MCIPNNNLVCLIYSIMNVLLPIVHANMKNSNSLVFKSLQKEKEHSSTCFIPAKYKELLSPTLLIPINSNNPLLSTLMYDCIKENFNVTKHFTPSNELYRCCKAFVSPSQDITLTLPPLKHC